MIAFLKIANKLAVALIIIEVVVFYLAA